MKERTAKEGQASSNYYNTEKAEKIRKTSDSENDIYKDEKILYLIRDYIIDRKPAIFLFLSTCLIFVVICSLYQLHNITKLLYAFLLALFVWVFYGIFDASRYIQKRKKIYIARRHSKQIWTALINQSLPGIFCELESEYYNFTKRTTLLDKAYESLIEDLCRLQSSLESETRLRRGEMTDYYMMWAHQIKTPIAAMKLLLSEREDSFLLMEELFKIEQYVDMVLYYLRLESIALDMIIKEHDLQTLVKQSVRKYSVLFINSGLKLQLEDFDVKVLTDEKWLAFVLEQIISNSIKYTRKGTVSIYMKPETEKTLVIEDTGIGIREEDVPRIFDRGFTGYNGHMDKKSTGIGLYLCKQIMNRLSHGIWVSSMEDTGTKVYLDLSRENYTDNAD
jgi:signal transduction histidine kinase